MATITNISLPNGFVGSAYSATLMLTGGSGVPVFAVAGGTLPSGVSLSSSTGVLSGTPAFQGNYSITFSVTDTSGTTTKTLTILVEQALVLTGADAVLSGAVTGFTANIIGGTWSASTGSINPAGVFTAPIVTSGTATSTITYTTANGQVKTIVVTTYPDLTIAPNGSPLYLRAGSSTNFTINGGSGQYAYAVTGGSINQNGVFTAPATSGTVILSYIDTLLSEYKTLTIIVEDGQGICITDVNNCNTRSGSSGPMSTPSGGSGGPENCCPVYTQSAIQGNGLVGSPLKENLDALPAFTNTPTPLFVMAGDPANPDGSLATLAQIAALIGGSYDLEEGLCDLADNTNTPAGGTNSAHPDTYVGADNSMYLSKPLTWIVFSCPASPTGRGAIPVFQV